MLFRSVDGEVMRVLWDAPMVASVARELNDRMEGARLRAVGLDREDRNLLLHFRSSTLLFRLHPLEGDVTLHGAREPAPDAHSLKARLREVHAPPDERLLMLQLQPSGGAAEPEGIVVELMTNQWNAVWLRVGTRRIRRVLWPRELQERTLAGGEIYRRPSPSRRRGIDEPLSEEDWLETLAGTEPEARRGLLLRSIAFTSSLSAGALLGRGDAAAPGESDRQALRRGYRLWREIRAVALGEREARPRLLRTAKRIHPYPLRLPGVESSSCDSMLDGFSAAADEDGDAAPDAALFPSGLLERLEDAVAAAGGKAARLRTELARTPDPDPIRRTGDLLLARYGEIPRGTGTTTLEGFDGEPVEVELDPALGPDENAQRYYRRAASAERARERLPGMIRDAEDRAQRLEGLLGRARRGDAEPGEVREALPPERRRESDGGKEEGTGLPYRTYHSSGGLQIRVGRGAEENEELTFHHSNPDDIWLHARQATGAHVILIWSRDDNPPARDLTEAATLAALHSEARHSGSVPVDWTRRKYVRSPRKSPPGAVVPDRIRTIFVEPDPALEKKLRAG